MSDNPRRFEDTLGNGEYIHAPLPKGKVRRVYSAGGAVASDDIVTRIHNHLHKDPEKTSEFLLGLAADEIERLRNRLEKFERAAWELSMNGIFTHSVSGQIALDTYTKAVRGE